MQLLQEELSEILKRELFVDDRQYDDFAARVRLGNLTKQEDLISHCCVFFVPVRKHEGKIFIVDHKKARQWVVPGGHVEKGEGLVDAVGREAMEELSIEIESVGRPFMMSIMNIDNRAVGQLCRVHHDIWYTLEQEKVSADLREFNDARWVSFGEARSLITHPMYLRALNRIENFV